MHVVCGFHLSVTMLAGINIGLKFWHFSSAVCNTMGVQCGGHHNQGVSIGLVG